MFSAPGIGRRRKIAKVPLTMRPLPDRILEPPLIIQVELSPARRGQSRPERRSILKCFGRIFIFGKWAFLPIFLIPGFENYLDPLSCTFHAKPDLCLSVGLKRENCFG